MKVSVALAYYNGGMYIREQLDTILCQLEQQDEVVISVDGAQDGSLSLLSDLAKDDARIRIIMGPGKGVVRNFENALRYCGGDFIFLSDQDDIWEKNKVETVKEEFQNPEIMAVIHDAGIVNERGEQTGEESLFSMRKSRPGVLKNFIKNSYVGCCMAFRRELLAVICPIPEAMYMHDYWIGMAAERMGKVSFLPQKLIGYRRHSSNVTQMSHGSVKFMIKKRVDILRCLVLLRRRVKEWKNERE